MAMATKKYRTDSSILINRRPHIEEDADDDTVLRPRWFLHTPGAAMQKAGRWIISRIRA